MAKKRIKQNKRKTRRKATNNANARNNAPRSNKGQNTPNKTVKTAKPVHNSANNSQPPKTANNKPKDSKEKQGVIQRLLVVLGLVKDKKQANTARKNMDLTKEHPRFPFWARFLKDSKHRTTLVIDEEKSLNNRTKKIEDQFVHREATTPTEDEKRNNKYERISPNPDKTKKTDMLLKRATKMPKSMFVPHNKELDMPKDLKDKYDKNNDKDKKE